MANFKISTRLAALLAVLCLLILGVGLAGIWGMRGASAGLETVYEDRVIPLKQIKAVSDMYAVNVVDAAHKVRDGGMTPEQGLASLTAARKTIQANWSAYLGTQFTGDEQQLVERFKPLQVKADAAVAAVEGLVRGNDVPGLTAYAAKEMYPAIDPLQEVLGALIQLQLDKAKAEYEGSQATYQTLRAVALGAMVAALALAVVVGGGMTRQISHELAGAVRITDAVAQGDLTVAIDHRGKDEIAQLLGGFARMRDNLSNVVAGVRSGAEGVANASTEIAHGNNDLSARTEQQASALQETAASMEQLSSTVRQNADNARQANQLALSASTVAEQGGNVVAEVVQTMKGINDSSHKIADIIGVIDGIAFQTNILALNAAVEAARAGEQGRGFAVVAGEVRSLAQRSADAAKEIKGLIHASVERVEEGTVLVDKAGTTMTEVVASIRRVTDIMGEISAASNEQSQGVAQVGEAITQMDQATQQNAALVEESAAAAAGLSQQAQDLVQSVAVFRLAPSATAGRSSPAPARAVPFKAASVSAKAPAPAARKPLPAKAAPAPLAARAPTAPALSAPAVAAPTPAASARTAAKPAPRPAAGSDDDWETF